MKNFTDKPPINMVLRSFSLYRLLLFLPFLFLTFSAFAQEGNVDAGKTLFRNNCASCHNRDMKSKMTGPALAGFEERWADYPEEDLHNWIRNSQALIEAGHPRATELWNEWGPTVMTSFPNLTDQDINDILAYIDFAATAQPETTASPGVPGVAAEKPDNTWLYIVVAAVLAILALVLARIVANLDYLIKAKEGKEPPSRQTLRDILTSKGVIGFAVFALVVIGGYTTVNKAIELGRQQGYQPEQPIKFSHALHAGTHQIDCQYCHDGARRSKASVIPATNTCMNCHKAIKKGSQYGTAELTKIFASIGYNPNTDTYISNYEAMPVDSIERIFKKWIADNYVADQGKLDEGRVNEQWDGVVAALTGPEDPNIQGPIEWLRIHNLPDHVYFNHAQHVSVGKIECQKCHGKIEEMEVVTQYSPLSMGWCVNCHRETEVKFNENAYYDNYYELYHKELQEGKRSKVTVEDIGGIGCQRCHY